MSLVVMPSIKSLIARYSGMSVAECDVAWCDPERWPVLDSVIRAVMWPIPAFPIGQTGNRSWFRRVRRREAGSA